MKNDNFNCRIVQDMGRKIRELELEKIDYMQQRFKETQKQLILKEKKAKRDLVEVDEQNNKIKKKSEPKRNLIINAWEVQQYQDEKWIQNPILPLPIFSSINRKYQKRLSINEKENEDSIPKLKYLLKNLESPEKKIDKSKNTTLDLNDLYSNTKKKNLMRTLDILKIQEQGNNTPSQTILRPISNRAMNSHHGNGHLIPIRFSLVKNQNKNSKKCLQEPKQNQIMVKMIKKKRNDQEIKLIHNQTMTPKQDCEYNLLKRDKLKERMTLLKLLS